MAPIILKTFELPIDCEVYLSSFWSKPGFYERFLVEKLSDVGVQIGEWSIGVDNPNTKLRTVRCFHPSKISFPGLPSHAEVNYF